jgi:hypothetical protein
VIEALQPGDVLMVTRLDQLARSTRDLLNTLAAIADRKAGFRSLGDAWADTTTSYRRVMLSVLGGLAEFERDLIRARTGEGRARAVARGVKMGRKPKLTPHPQKEAIKRRDHGDETLAEIARSYNVSSATISPADGLRLASTSPHFLRRTELGKRHDGLLPKIRQLDRVEFFWCGYRHHRIVSYTRLQKNRRSYVHFK